MMSPKLFNKCGETLFGDQWKSKMARFLHVSRQTILRWSNGEYLVPPDKQMQIYNLVRFQIKTLKNYLKENSD